VEYEAGAFKVTGHAALPSVTESSRSAQTVSVNGRWVRSENLHRGLDDAYRATVPGGRYPPVALDLQVDPRRIDVNVHPTKQVVRFSDERAAREAVGSAVRAAIEWRTQPPSSPPRPAERPFAQDRLSSGGPGWNTSSVAEGSPAYPAARDVDLGEARERLVEASRPAAERGLQAPESSGAAAPELPERGGLPPLEGSRIIGQLAAGYILLEEPESLWVVDQHVAHERAILDRLNDAGGSTSGSPATTQSLLVPEIVELAPGQAEQAAEYLEELVVYGFAGREGRGRGFQGRARSRSRDRYRTRERGPHPGHHRLPLGGKDGRPPLPA
jgi:DNA mismatch repair protein MutL